MSRTTRPLAREQALPRPARAGSRPLPGALVLLGSLSAESAPSTLSRTILSLPREAVRLRTEKMQKKKKKWCKGLLECVSGCEDVA